MTVTANLINASFVDPSILETILNKIKSSDWVPTHERGLYASDKWRVIKLISNGKADVELEKYPEIQNLIQFFKCKIDNVVLYSILPGGTIHPHRDLSGTFELGRLRFHIPLRTDPQVDFYVADKKYYMKPGELWALNTSYKHAVENNSDVDRIHLVIMVEVNDWCRSMLPKLGLAYYCHFVGFFCLIGWVALKTIIEPKKFKGRLKLVPHMMRFFKKKYFK